MKQTPAHDSHNPDLLRLIPANLSGIIEIGCSSGALAREYKKVSPNCNYFGVDIDSSYLESAKCVCDGVEACDLETQTEEFYAQHAFRDCWVFGDTLEHFKNPWVVLENIRKVIPSSGCVVACIPNAQHWSLVAKMAIGDFRYVDSGLLDRTHLRWFSRQTIVELFKDTGFIIEEGAPRIFHEPARDSFLPIIANFASACGVDQNLAVNDAIPLQWVVRARPA